MAPSGTVSKKYLLESVFREDFENWVPSGAKGAKSINTRIAFVLSFVINLSLRITFVNTKTTSKSILRKRASLSRKIEPV